MKFSWKNIEKWRSWKMRFFWGGHFEFSKSAILNFFFASSLWKIQPFFMRYHFFLHYGWFLQNFAIFTAKFLIGRWSAKDLLQWESVIYHSIKPGFEGQVAKRFLNAYKYQGTLSWSQNFHAVGIVHLDSRALLRSFETFYILKTDLLEIKKLSK